MSKNRAARTPGIPPHFSTVYSKLSRVVVYQGYHRAASWENRTILKRTCEKVGLALSGAPRMLDVPWYGFRPLPVTHCSPSKFIWFVSSCQEAHGSNGFNGILQFYAYMAAFRAGGGSQFPAMLRRKDGNEYVGEWCEAGQVHDTLTPPNG